MSGDSPRTLRIDVPALARVEGEGALRVRVRDGAVTDVRLEIYEPPRFFEAFLRGRRFDEAPDITARICGICPVAYQTSAVKAMEATCGVEVGAPIRALRRLLYCGEWIESHALHVTMLHAPDFLGYEGGIEMAADHREEVVRGLALKKTGNDLVTAVGGREIHPVNVRVGGFHKAPRRAELRRLLDPLKRARDASLETVRWVAGFEFPEFESRHPSVSLRSEGEYPIDGGRVVSTEGLDVPAEEYERHFAERQVRHSTALHSFDREGGIYLTGPLARYNLNSDRLTPAAAAAAREAGLGATVANPFRSILVRSVELVVACEEAIRIVETYEPPDPPAVPVEPRPGIGCGVSEAPRGLLYHRYQLDGAGTILKAKITPPTAQNQPAVEEDLRRVVAANLDLPKDRLTWRCEQAIRNHDPCISCAAHFLRLEVEEA